MAKAPSIQFYVRDWLSDPELQSASLISRGAWIQCLCFMWENSRRGELTRTPLKFARLIGGSLDEALHFLNEIYEYEFGDVIVDENVTFPLQEKDCNAIVTIRNRRMWSDYKDRQNTRLRVRKYREKQDVTQKKQKSNANVTLSSSSSSSTSNTYSVNFEKFWNEYPNKISKKAAYQKWQSLKKKNQLPSLQTLIDAIQKQKQWRNSAANGEFRPEWKHPATWLNQGCWEDECKSEIREPSNYYKEWETPDYLKDTTKSVGKEIK